MSDLKKNTKQNKDAMDQGYRSYRECQAQFRLKLRPITSNDITAPQAIGTCNNYVVHMDMLTCSKAVRFSIDSDGLCYLTDHGHTWRVHRDALVKH